MVYTFAANADSLTLDSSSSEEGGKAELHATDFDPLNEGHSVRFGDITCSTTEPGPEDLVKLAIEACRVIALRLHAHGLNSFVATRTWPEGAPTFVDIVKGAIFLRAPFGGSLAAPWTSPPSPTEPRSGLLSG